MSVVEDPVLTVARLLRQFTNQAVLKDDGSFAKVPVTTQIFDRKFLQENDAQITVALEQSTDQKLELAGRLRRRSVLIRSTIWAVDKPAPDADAGQVMRDKLVVKINTIIRERRNLPNEAPALALPASACSPTSSAASPTSAMDSAASSAGPSISPSDSPT